jgi:hypothetical protein
MDTFLNFSNPNFIKLKKTKYIFIPKAIEYQMIDFLWKIIFYA